MIVLTIPGIKHICDEVVYEGDLRLGHAAGVPVKHRHHHRQTLSLLLIRLQGKHTQTHTEEITMRLNLCDTMKMIQHCSELLTASLCSCCPHTCAKYSSEIRPAHSMQSSSGLQGFATSAHLISILFISRRFSGEFLMLA